MSAYFKLFGKDALPMQKLNIVEKTEGNNSMFSLIN